MKIGIITLSASDNCGSLLQAYALQNILIRKYNHQVEIIDFRPKESNKIYSIFPRNPFAEKHRFLNAVFHYARLKKQKEAYEEFRETKLFLTNKVFVTMESLCELDGRYDVIISGSDQVWNVMMKDYSDAFFLGWSKKSIKYSYAPSLGGHDIFEADNKEEIISWLNQFKAISVREKMSVDVIKQACGKDVPMLLDPTLLISANYWQDFAGEKIIKGEYIFYYSWAYNSKDINNIVKEFGKRMGLPIYVINASKWTRYKPEIFGFKLCKDAGPMAFLKLMKYAKYALVQSFHGIIFAYQMRRDFWLLDDQPKEKMDSRLSQILKLLKAEDRVLRSINDVSVIKKTEFNYNQSRLELNSIMRQSFEFLHAIGEEKTI